MEKILEVKQIEKYYGNKSNLTKAIDNISFDVNEGEFVGIMGASGSGKTTLLNCISTIDKVTSGNIIINGENITKLKVNKFRREELGFIFQDFNLLDTLTVYENIALALTIQKVKPKEIDSRVKEIAKKLDISEILNKYPYQISGGQKQLISFARALIKNPKLLVLDEATSSIDTETEKIIQNKMKDILKGKTSIIVAHRLSTIKHCDKIVLIENGNILEQGTHLELLDKKGIYYKMYISEELKI